jgi:hypothetical protein
MADLGESHMFDGRLFGPILLLAGSVLLFLPAATPAPLLPIEDADSLGLALIALGFSLALLAWRAMPGQQKPVLGGAWQQISASLVQRRPAKRMKIRIRCAR